MRKIIVATNNRNKLAEFRDILSTVDVELVSLAEAGINADPDENGTTLTANAEIKARAVYDQCHMPVMADDTGLFIDALDGRPGIYSARYAGPDGNNGGNIDKVLAELGSTPRKKRTARFITVICLIDENGVSHYFHGCCEGWIAFERQGIGFGYEPIFCMNNGFSLADMGQKAKDRRSHRARATHKLAFYLRETRKYKGRFKIR